MINKIYNFFIDKIVKITGKINKWISLWIFLSITGTFTCNLIVPANGFWYNLMAGLVGATVQVIMTKIMEDISKKMENNNGQRS